MAKVLIACEFSGIVRAAFRARGHDAWSCDLLPSEKPGPHIQGDVLAILDQGWDLLIAFPPCTYLCRAGWHWVNAPDSSVLPLKGRPRRRAAREAAKFFRALLTAPVPRLAVENPRPICHVKLPPCQQTIHPWQFGHGESKATCLWLRNLPLLTPTRIVRGRRGRVHFESPGPERSKNRSRTLTGIARAMAVQWGDL